MPTVSLIDGQDPMWPETERSEQKVTHTVTDRNGALDILRADLQATADPQWGHVILMEFQNGANRIEKPNGDGYYFRVEYEV
jgi:hypothetical protein